VFTEEQQARTALLAYHLSDNDTPGRLSSHFDAIPGSTAADEPRLDGSTRILIYGTRVEMTYFESSRVASAPGVLRSQTLGADATRLAEKC